MLPVKTPSVPHLPPARAACHPSGLAEKSVTSAGGVNGAAHDSAVEVPVVPPTAGVPPLLVAPPVPPEPPRPSAARASGGLAAALSPPPASAVEVVPHTHAANVPAKVQTCAPCWPEIHAHTTLAPGTQPGGTTTVLCASGASASYGELTWPPADVLGEPPLPPTAAASGQLVAPPPASTVGTGHTHAAYVLADVHVCVPCWPAGHAHTMLAPGTHVPL